MGATKPHHKGDRAAVKRWYHAILIALLPLCFLLLAPAAASADEDDSVGIVVEIAPIPDCGTGCETPPAVPLDVLPSAGLDASPALLLAFGFGAVGLLLLVGRSTTTALLRAQSGRRPDRRA